MAATRVATAPHGSLRAARSTPALSAKSGLHHRGEHAFGTVKGLNHSGEELYVPRALWTTSLASPLKNPSADYDPKLFAKESKQLQQYNKSMTNFVRQQLGRQVEENKAAKRNRKADVEDEMRATNATLSKTIQEQRMKQDQVERNRQTFRDGLAEQTAHHAEMAREHRLREAHEAAEIKLRTTQQLCKEFAEVQQRKEETKREFADTMSRLDRERQEKRAVKTLECDELRRTMGQQFNDESSRQTAQQTRLHEAMASQDACYAHFAATQGKEQAARVAREDKRQERDVVNHQLRTDLMYAQRELARERQRQTMRQDLDDQVEAKRRLQSTHKCRQEYEKQAVVMASRGFLESELSVAQQKRAERVENQASLIEQMHDKQKQERRDIGSQHRLPSTTSTMQVSDSLLAIASAARGKVGSCSDLMTNLGAAKELSKPCGKPEVKPWIDITKSHGPGGLVGVFGGEGPTRSILMTTGGPERLLTKTCEIIERDRRGTQKKWYQDVSSTDLKAGRKVATKRLELAAADKALTHPP